MADLEKLEEPGALDPVSLPLESPASVPVREDQVQSALGFLTHPKVISSSTESKTLFLERKGLTSAEIAEAFKRVPKTQPLEYGTGIQPASPYLPPSAPPPPKPYHQAGAPVNYLVDPRKQEQAIVAQPGVRWTQVVVGLGLVAGSVYVAKEFLGPRIWHFAEGWLSEGKRKKAEEDEKARRADESARAVAAAIEGQTKELRASVEGLKEEMKGLSQSLRQTQASAEPSLSVHDLRQELRSFATTISEMSTPARPAGEASRSAIEQQVAEIKAMLTAQGINTPTDTPELDSPDLLASSVTPNGTVNWHGSVPGAGYSPSPPASRALFTSPAASTPTHTPQGFAPAAGSPAYYTPQAYRPSSRTPSPQPGSPLSRYAAVAGPTATAAGAFAGHRPAAAEDGRPSASAAAHGTKSAPGSVAGDSERAAGALHPPAEPPSPPVPHPQSYADVLGMLDAGLTPPGIRTDIQDKPPNPTQAPSDPKMKPRPKPWERAQQNSKQQQLPFGSLKSIFEPPRADSPAGARPAVPAAAAPTRTPTSSENGRAEAPASETEGSVADGIEDGDGGSSGGFSGGSAWKPPAVPTASVPLHTFKAPSSTPTPEEPAAGVAGSEASA